jgi:outer membrane translocation and assembly module TamA
LECFVDLNIDTRDNSYFPHKGFYSKLRVSLFPKIFENEKTFLKAEINSAYFVTLNILTSHTLAFKGGGGIVSNDYPFFESVFLGGADNLRGYTRRRFSGDASLYGQAELRTYLFPLKIIVPGKFGVHGLIEAGRVFDEVFKGSKKWHPSYGGGIWMTFVDNSISGSVTFAASKETASIYANLGMGF